MTLAEHVAALVGREPAWCVVRDGTFGPAALEGPVVVRGATGKEYRFRVRIDLPSGFPARDSHPEVWLLESPFLRHDDAHVNEEGTLCVELPQAHEINYEAVGLLGFFDQVVLHLDRVRIHALSKKYPGRAYAHGDDGVRQYVREVHEDASRNLPPSLARVARPGARLPPDRQWCPCGSGRRFKSCHKEEVKQVRGRVAAAGPCQRSPVIGKSRNPFRRARR